MLEYLFGGKPAKPATVPTDTIIPLYPLDNNAVYRGIIVDFTMRFDDVLDHAKLCKALDRLMNLGDWRKLGARIRMDNEQRLEYHVPAVFTQDRPCFIYSHVSYDIDIADHPLASRLPKATSRPSVQAGALDFRSLARRPDGPTKLEDYVYSDEPQLSMHIVSFEDATLVSFSWPHTLFDIMGKAAFLNALALVLSDQEDRVPPLHGFDKDPLARFGDSEPEEPHVLANRQLIGFNLIVFGLYYLFELRWWRRESQRLVCLPGSYLHPMKRAALSELQAEAPGGERPFLSDGDIICAWWTRLATQCIPASSNRTVVIMNAFDLRKLLSKDLLPAGKAYLSNASQAVFAMVPAYQIFQRPLSFLASMIRLSVQEQGTRSQLEGFAALRRETHTRTGHEVAFGDRSCQLIIFSNWTKAKLFDLDFSAAVVKQGIPARKRVHQVGRPSYIDTGAFMKGFSPRNSFPIIGRDACGNYWIGGAMRESIWSKVEAEIGKM